LIGRNVVYEPPTAGSHEKRQKKIGFSPASVIDHKPALHSEEILGGTRGKHNEGRALFIASSHGGAGFLGPAIMDLGELWSKVQTTASEIAAAAEETAARAYTAVEETGEMAAKSEAWLAMSSQFAKLQSDASFTFAELRARTVSEAERAERLILLKQEEAERRARARVTADIDTEIYGVNIDHECFVRDFTERTFLEYPVEDGDDELDETWEMDEWERDHAEACMAVVPELATLRFALCRDPAHHLLTPGAEPMSEARFWRTYFRMCGWRLALAEASFKARAAARAKGIEVADDDPFPVEVDKAELEAFGFRVDDELLDQAAELIAEDLDEILGEEGEIQQARIERERAKKAEWLRTRKEWKPPDGSESPGGSSPNRGEEGGKKSDGDSDRADSPAPPTGKEDGSVADSEDSGVLVEAPVEREK
jgi:hypothetical protein